MTEIIEEIKKELQRLKLEAPSDFQLKEYYTYDDFLKYDDEEFVENIYRGILKREVDTVGLKIHLDLLRSGKMTKSEIISSLHKSKEGRIAHVSLSDLPFQIKKRYTYSDFMQYDDEEFVRNVYRGILKRVADIDGFNHLLKVLRSGEATKEDIIASLRKCEEGKIKNVEISEPFEIKESYIYDDFLRYNGEEFIRNIYIGLLKREADIIGLAAHLKLLNENKMNKKGIILSLRESGEGTKANIELKENEE